MPHTLTAATLRQRVALAAARRLLNVRLAISEAFDLPASAFWIIDESPLAYGWRYAVDPLGAISEGCQVAAIEPRYGSLIVMPFNREWFRASGVVAFARVLYKCEPHTI